MRFRLAASVWTEAAAYAEFTVSKLAQCVRLEKGCARHRVPTIFGDSGVKQFRWGRFSPGRQLSGTQPVWQLRYGGQSPRVVLERSGRSVPLYHGRGSWSESVYRFNDPSALSPWDRSATQRLPCRQVRGCAR